MAQNCTTEIETPVRSGRIDLLPQMRKYQCAFIWPSLQESGYTHGRRIGHRGASLHDEGGLFGGMPSGDRAFINDVRADNGTDRDVFPEAPDWLNDGPTLETPMPRDIQEFTDAERGAYNLGVTDERLRRARLR